ncbi:MAG: barstar family protein [Firmicutes bacterium]|nr:barstar family protein [Bacillota bacterium]
MKTIILPAARLNDDPHPYLAEVFGFPSWYGRNLDALYDLLTDICEPTSVYFWKAGELDSYGKRILLVFRDAEESCRYLFVYEQ